MVDNISTQSSILDTTAPPHPSPREAPPSKDIPLDSPRGLADFIWARYKSGKPRDARTLDKAIEMTQIAVDSTQESTERVQLLCDLGGRLAARYGLSNALDDLNRAISANGRAVQLTLDKDPSQVARLYRYATSLHLRFKRLGELDDLNAATAALRCAAELMQDDNPNTPALLIIQGVFLKGRFETVGEHDDIDHALSTFSRADALMSDGHPLKPECSEHIGRSRLERFERFGNVEDLEKAISAHRYAVEHTPDSHPNQPSRCSSLGSSLLARFQRTGQLEDIKQAVTAYDRAVDFTPDGHPRKPSRYSNLGNALIVRFENTGEIQDLERAISVHHRAVDLTLDDHPDQPSQLNNLGNAFLARFKRIGELDDLDRATSAHGRAIDLTPNDHPRISSRYNNLGISLVLRFECTREHAALEQGLSAHRLAVELTLDDHPDQIKQLNNLGRALNTRFDHIGDIGSLEEAISLLRHAISLAPDGHPDKILSSINLGNSLLTRFERTGELSNLEQAVSIYRRALELMPTGHADQALLLNSLGCSLHTRFKRTGNKGDLEEAISIHCRAVDITPDDHPDKPSRFGGQGDSLLMRFERTGELEDLERAISAHRRAIELSTVDSDMPARFNNLGNSLLKRFARNEELEDLKQAISMLRQAVELTPDAHPDKSSRLHNLGNSLSRKYEDTRELDDLEQALSTRRRALELTSDDHPQKPRMLSQLSQALRSRFERTRELTDIHSAISAGQQAVNLSLEGHPDLWQHYSSLSGCFQRRFEYTGDIEDIHKAHSLSQKVVALISDDDPRFAPSLVRLGGVQMHLFERSQTRTDFDAAFESFISSTMQSLGIPTIRLNAARRSLRTCSYWRVIAILPELVWLGHGIHRRYEEASRLGELVNTASSAALAAGVLTQAVEWLEAGRALLWAQVLALRTPLDELREFDPNLADMLHRVQRMLQSSAYSTFASDNVIFGGIVGLSVNPAADEHRKAAIDYDRLLKQIRTCPGFEDFLRPKGLQSLTPSPGLMNGPVVFINVHSTRCDAVLLHADGTITTVRLSELSLMRASLLRSLWNNGLAGYRYRLSGIRLQDPPGENECQLLELVPDSALGIHRHTSSVNDERDLFIRVMEYTWTWIVEPVLRSLDLSSLAHNSSLPHITWCPTGPLMQLPLHAAGIYDQLDGPRMYDFVVSSYIPSLSALTRSAHAASDSQATRDVLIVTQPSTPGHTSLPGTVHEGTRLRDILASSKITSHWLNDEDATVQEVRSVMKEYPWVHLACHGSRNREDATQSAFHLFDGELTLADLMGTAADNAELAFLSACETAVGDEKTPEESAHLAAGMLAVGFKGVIATMWAIQDADAPVVVEAYYKELLALRGAGGLGKGETGAAYALHEATRVLREQVGETSFMRWVPFVHFGV